MFFDSFFSYPFLLSSLYHVLFTVLHILVSHSWRLSWYLKPDPWTLNKRIHQLDVGEKCDPFLSSSRFSKLMNNGSVQLYLFPVWRCDPIFPLIDFWFNYIEQFQKCIKKNLPGISIEYWSNLNGLISLVIFVKRKVSCMTSLWRVTCFCMA